jgi:hypothetical protein
MSTEAILLTVLVVLCAAGLGWLVVDEWRCRRQRRIDAFELAELERAETARRQQQAAQRAEANGLASEAAVTYAAAADRAWTGAHGTYDPADLRDRRPRPEPRACVQTPRGRAQERHQHQCRRVPSVDRRLLAPTRRPARRQRTTTRTRQVGTV